jgi:hypothetical protein
MTKHRVLIYEGPEDWLEATRQEDRVKGVKIIHVPRTSISSLWPTAYDADNCPVCGSDDILPNAPMQEWSQAPLMTEPRMCRVCKAEWTARYVHVENTITFVPQRKGDEP